MTVNLKGVDGVLQEKKEQDETDSFAGPNRLQKIEDDGSKEGQQIEIIEYDRQRIVDPRRGSRVPEADLHPHPETTSTYRPVPQHTTLSQPYFEVALLCRRNGVRDT